MESYDAYTTRVTTDTDNRLCLWELDTVFRVKICTAGYVNVADADEVRMAAFR